LIGKECEYSTCRNPQHYDIAESSDAIQEYDIIDSDYADFYDTGMELVET